MSLSVVPLCVLAAAVASSQPPPFDLAPPAVRSPSAAPLEPEIFDRLTFHRPPKPLAPGATTNDWPHLLGPAFDLNADESPLLATWPAGGPLPVWEIERGLGHAAPTIAGDYLVFHHRLGEKEVVECVHPETGKRYWIRELDVKHGVSYGVADAPRASPTIDGEFVYTIGVASHLRCIHLATGTVVWKRDLQSEFGVPHGFFGKGGSPLIHEDKLILNLGAEKDRCVAAFDKLKGTLVWNSTHGWGASYASPMTATLHGKRRILVFAGGQSEPTHGGLLCIDPAQGAITGSVPWRPDMFASVNAASPVAIGNRIFITEAYGNGGAFIDIAPDFSAKLFRTAPGFGSQFSTPVHHEGFLYGFDGQSDPGASLVCYEAATGNEIWRDRAIAIGRGSLLRINDSFLCVGEHGELLKLDLSPRGARVLVESRLFEAPESFTAPVVCRGLLYICQNGRDLKTGAPPRLICYDLRGGKK